MFSLIACTSCRRARLVEAGRKTAQCGACGRSIELGEARTYWTGADLEEGRHATGLLNAKLAHREDEFASSLLPQAPPPTRHDDPYASAAAATRHSSSEKDRVDRLTRALGAALPEFCQSDLERAFDLVGLPSKKLDAHVRRMLETSVLYEPRAGRYRAF
ncbi:MAG: hypothetical protein WDA16_06545 [Candidatus Thermoplasmatota archaeon]